MTIRTRLALWYSGLLTVTIIILSLVVMTVSRVSILTTVDHVLDQTAAGVINSILVVPVGEFGALQTELVFKTDDLFKSPGVSVQVWQTHNGTQPITPHLVKASVFLTEPLDAPALHQTEDSYHNITIDTTPVRVISRPFFGAGGQPIGVVQAATSIQHFEQTTDMLIIIVIIAALFSILISVALSLQVAKRILHPIGNVTRAAASIVDARDLSTRIAWSGPMDELGQLTQMFNRMMERLEHVFGVQQRFVGDVSHEMRTPLTSILGHLEIMDRYGVDQESLDAVQREAGRMSRMVNDLLLLVRADNGELQVERYSLDLDGVVLEVYEQALILAKGRSLKMLLERIEPARILGNSDRLKQLLLNLVNNAIKFTGDGGKVALAVYVAQQHAVIDVTDTGIGIAEKDLRRIFDRFYQADNSRVHHSDSDGAGLGLSIVRWIVEAHEGRIEVFSTLGEGTTFRVHLPLLAHHQPPPPTDTGDYAIVTGGQRQPDR
ncbi:MAG: ATP-binding protein [Anaerolineae bacterium]|nr:ATP-binding protein [Anaerolineae bacterium]